MTSQKTRLTTPVVVFKIFSTALQAYLHKLTLHQKTQQKLLVDWSPHMWTHESTEIQKKIELSAQQARLRVTKYVHRHCHERK
jgi:hypothetical protein